MTTKGCTVYHEPKIANPPPSTTPTNKMAWERRTRIDPVETRSLVCSHLCLFPVFVSETPC